MKHVAGLQWQIMDIVEVPFNTSKGKLECPLLAAALFNKTAEGKPLEFTYNQLATLGCLSIDANSWIEQVCCWQTL